MVDISISEARANLPETIRRARKKPLLITNHGQPQAVLIDPSLYEKFVEAIEELEDIEDFDSAMNDGESGIPWDQIKKDLGI